MTIPKIDIELTYCKKCFFQLITYLKIYLKEEFGERIRFIDKPVEKDKCYIIKIKGEIVYSILDPIDDECAPILFTKHNLKLYFKIFF